jgi:indole-3-glycerol phosphate synthase
MLHDKVASCNASRRPALVSESGISSPETLKLLRSAGFNGFLLGEAFMKETSPGQALKDFIKEI